VFFKFLLEVLEKEELIMHAIYFRTIAVTTRERHQIQRDPQTGATLGNVLTTDTR